MTAVNANYPVVKEDAKISWVCRQDTKNAVPLTIHERKNLALPF